MGKAAPPATPPRPVRNTASWSGTAYSSGQARLISQLTLISGGRSPIRHVGTRRVGDGRPTAEVEAVRSRILIGQVYICMHKCYRPQRPVCSTRLGKISLSFHVVAATLKLSVSAEQKQTTILNSCFTEKQCKLLFHWHLLISLVSWFISKAFQTSFGRAVVDDHFNISSDSVSVFGRAIHSLAKIGDEVYFEPLEQGVSLVTFSVGTGD